MTERFLLYIDLLGFSEFVRLNPELLPDLFRALDRSNAHAHHAFKVIQFSDTLLIYNEHVAGSNYSKHYCAMYLCEFAQEIQYMLLGRDAFLRGLITYGKFEDTGPTPNKYYKNIRAFWGDALIDTHVALKNIQAIGLFVDQTVKPHMDIFETHSYNEQSGIWFADTATSLKGKFFDGNDFSYAREDAILSGNESLLAYDLYYLKQLFEHGHNKSIPPSVRTKYLTTWEYYRQKYKGLCTALEDAKFEFRKVIDIDWKPFIDSIGTPQGYFH